MERLHCICIVCRLRTSPFKEQGSCHHTFGRTDFSYLSIQGMWDFSRRHCFENESNSIRNVRFWHDSRYELVVNHRASMDCFAIKIVFRKSGYPELEFEDDRRILPTCVISTLEAKRLVHKGCETYLVMWMTSLLLT